MAGFVILCLLRKTEQTKNDNNKKESLLTKKPAKMKTRTNNRKADRKEVIFAMIVTMMLLQGAVAAQEPETRTLLRSDIKVTEMWTPEVKINSIQGEVGTLIGFYGGALFNRTLLLGISGGVNLGHPTVNYGYFGGIAQVITYPGNIYHLSGQILLAYGTTKDYEDPKTGLLDNFWNISGESFFITEPGINLEVNLSQRVTFVVGMSYRYVTGIDADNENISITRVTNEDMSGINFNIGLKFAKKEKK
jgi:hypothetical protein